MIGKLVRGRYELTGLVQEGPVFSSFAARDRQTGRDVCLRVVKPQYAKEPSFVEALRSAVQKYRALPATSIEMIHELGVENDTVFLVGDLTRSPTLGDRIRKLAPFSVPASVATGVSICQALDAVHRANVVHGDVSGQNVIVLANGEVRLQLAGIWEAYSGSASAGVAVLPGMAPYLAPEVAGGELPSTSSDVYAVGILLYDLLTGREPYQADTAVATAMRHAQLATPRVSTMNPSVPDVLDEIVYKAMAKNPRDRYQTAGALLADLKLVQDALRFGKTLTWPLTPAEGKRPQAAKEPGPVAPKMSAIREPEDDTDRAKRRKERDVPIWMMVILAVMFAVMVTLLGVWLTFNLSKPKLIAVPNIKGLTTNEARVILDPLKLSLRIQKKEANDTAPQDQILDVSPEPGQTVREGSSVGVIISAGSLTVSVPDLKGETVDKATTVLSSVGLELDPSVSNIADSDHPAGQVVNQTPEKGAKVERGTRVRLTISLGALGDQNPTTPDNAYIYTLDIKVSNVARPTKVRVEITDLEGTRVAYDELHKAGETAHVSVKGYGTEATFKIYYDDQLVKELTKKVGEDGTPQ